MVLPLEVNHLITRQTDYEMAFPQYLYAIKSIIFADDSSINWGPIKFKSKRLKIKNSPNQRETNSIFQWQSGRQDVGSSCFQFAFLYLCAL